MNDDKNRKIYGFDSFKGFPEPDKIDLLGKAGKGHYATSYKFVKEFLERFFRRFQKYYFS